MTWHARPQSSVIVTLASVRTSTQGRRPQRNASCTIPASTTRSVKCMTAPPRWTGWSRRRNEASRSPSAATTCFWKDGDNSRAPINIIDTPGPRRLYRRSRALDAGLDGRHGLRFGRWRAAANRNSLAAGEQVRRTAPRVRQQDGPCRCGLLQVVHADARAAKANPVPIQIPIGAEDKFEGVVDLVSMKAIYWDDRPGDEIRVPRHSGRNARTGKGMAREDGRGRGRSQRRADGQVSRRQAITTEEMKQAFASGRSGARSRRFFAAPHSRTRACRRCSMPSSTTCRRRSNPAREGRPRPATRPSASRAMASRSPRWPSRS